jgi:hypothetical protein
MRENCRPKKPRPHQMIQSLGPATIPSKYLPASIKEFLPKNIPGLDDGFTLTPNLMQVIQKVVGAQVTIPLAPPTRFDVTEEAIQHNSGLLEAATST